MIVMKYAPIKFIAFAIQKNIELTKTDDPKLDNYIKPNETNEENPARRIMISIIKAVLSWNIGCGRAVEACIKRLAKNPKIFKQKIIEALENWNLFEIQLPKLQNTADDKLAYKPIKAVYL